MNKLYCLLLFLFFSEPERIISFDKFPNTIELKGHIIPIEYQAKFAALDVIDQYLIVSDYYPRDRLVHVFNKNSGKKIISFGKVGKGPSELLTSSRKILDPLNRNLWMGDIQRMKLWCFYLDSAISDANYVPWSIVLPRNIYPILDLSTCRSEYFIIPSLRGDYLYGTYNRKGENTGIHGQNQIQGGVDIGFISDISRINTLVNPENNRMVVAYRYFDLIEIYDLVSHTPLAEIRGPDHLKKNLQIKRGRENNNAINAYELGMSSDERYFYCLYNGRPTRSGNEGIPDVYYPRTIHVFDWDGNPVARLILDREICSFALDRERNRIIAFAVNGPFNFVEYPLPEILRDPL